jgi:hypothetical protein
MRLGSQSYLYKAFYFCRSVYHQHRSDKQAHLVGSLLWFLSLMQNCPLLLLVGVRVHSLSQLTIDEVKGRVNI